MLDVQACTVFVSENMDKSVQVSWEGHFFQLQRNDLLGDSDIAPEELQASDEKKSTITAPMPGTVIKINVSEGDKVKKGDVLLIVESMKMENNILAGGEGIVKKLNVSPKDMVEKNTVLVVLENE
jgi:biotin carboxyl carrier protein